jgi:hypothetical protein
LTASSIQYPSKKYYILILIYPYFFSREAAAAGLSKPPPLAATLAANSDPRFRAFPPRPKIKNFFSIDAF